jgi:hypothetical protein
MPVMLVTNKYFAHDFCFLDSAHHLVFKKAGSFRNWTSSTSQVNVCGQCYWAACTDRAILNYWTKYYVFFEYETLYKVQETMNPKCGADSFYVSEIKCSYLLFSVLVPYSADGSNPGYPPYIIPKLKWLHTKGNMSTIQLSVMLRLPTSWYNWTCILSPIYHIGEK